MSNRMKSNREIAKNDKARIKPAPVCKAYCKVTVGERSYHIQALNSDMLELKKAKHAASYKDKIVTFGKTMTL